MKKIFWIIVEDKIIKTNRMPQIVFREYKNQWNKHISELISEHKSIETNIIF